MADQREHQDDLPRDVANEDKVQTPGRKANAARPLNDADKAQGSDESRPVQDGRGSDARGALAQESGSSSGGPAGGKR